MDTKEISTIISKVVLETPLSETEKRFFDDWIADEKNKSMFDEVASGKPVKKIFELENEGFGDMMAARFITSISKILQQRRIVKYLRYSVSAAAVLGLFTFATIKIYNTLVYDVNKKISVLNKAINNNVNDDKIILITPKGDRIDLEKTSLKHALSLDNEKLVTTEQEKESVNVNNIVVVPPRKEYNLTLPDGTKVWLNSGSRLSFPSVFSDTIRTVEIEGEGYFDVVRSDNKRFIVKSKFFRTKVLGTKFMITSYEDNSSFELSLIEGSVDVTFTNNISHKIKSGEGVLFNKNDGSISVNDIDESKVLAKMNGYFVFNEMPLGDITNTLKRWYDIEFVFDDLEMREIKYFIETKKYENIEDIMLLLRNTKKIEYTILNRVVTIKKRN